MMSETDDGGRPQTRRWLDRLRRVRLVLAAATIVFAVLWAIGPLPLALALTGLAVVAAAALLGAGVAEAGRTAVAQDDRSALRMGDPLIELVLSGLPDPVVALDARGEVIALNARASMIAPALRPGEPVSLALRNPEVLDAIRRAAASGAVRRVEFFVRVPVERWYEAIVTPIELAAGPSLPPSQLVLMTFHDLTPLRRVEEMRADFVANASHELRTPLAALSGFIETLRGMTRRRASVFSRSCRRRRLAWRD
jgi:two-component system phosphate regulon sensor histidine kinase PhoR